MTHRFMPALLVSVIAGSVAASAPAAAHPHVWVAYATTVVYDQGKVTGLQHAWTFDDMYSAMAIQGLDKNGDGTYDREELAELAKINMEGLKEFEFFTYARLGTAALKFQAPVEPWLEYKNNVLTLHFRLPLSEPVLAEAEGLNFSVYDPTWFIAFDPEKTDPIKVAAAPEGCRASLADQTSTEADEDAKRLGSAFQMEFGGAASALGTAKTISISCKRS